VEQSLPFIRLSLLDSSESAASVNEWIQAGATVAEAESASADLIGVVGALSDAAITAWHVIYRAAEIPRPTAPGAAPGAGAGVFVFACDDPDSYAVVVLPGIRMDTLVIGGPGTGVLIDQANTDVIAFCDAMISSGFCNPFGSPLAVLVAAFYQLRP
jgi:hypothetical protein